MPFQSGRGTPRLVEINAWGSSPSPLWNSTRATFTEVEKWGEGNACAS